MALPKELQEDASLKKFGSVHALAGGYVNLQKLIGKDKISVPDAHTTDEEWQNIHRRLGLPDSIDKYEIKLKDGVKAQESFTKGFREQAYKLGVLPKQAQALSDWFFELAGQTEKQHSEDYTKRINEAVGNMKKDWGDAFDLNIARANKVANEVVGKEFAEYLQKSGLGNDEGVIRALAKIGEKMFKEDKVIGEGGGNGVMSPSEIQNRIRAIQADSRYYDKGHPQQKALVEEMSELFKKLHPGVDKK